VGAVQIRTSTANLSFADQTTVNIVNIAERLDRAITVCIVLDVSSSQISTNYLSSVFQKSIPAACWKTSIVATVLRDCRSMTSTVPGAVPRPSTGRFAGASPALCPSWNQTR
jgi:hypothetical protein